jgi:tRNA threonylcarbamoyladenosine biosynthesis protein TsaB
MPTSSKILVIDTATEFVFLSLVIDGKETGYRYRNDLRNHAVTVMPMLEELLQADGLVLTDINEVIVGIGPGSYTGVRIGVSIAKMIGYLNNIPVRTVSTLALIASGSLVPYVLSAIDARRGNAFIAGFRQASGTIELTYPDTLANLETFVTAAGPAYIVVNTAKPDIQKILRSNLLKPVGNIHELVPNYLQVTEAERNKGKA